MSYVAYSGFVILMSNDSHEEIRIHLFKEDSITSFSDNRVENVQIKWQLVQAKK